MKKLLAALTAGFFSLTLTTNAVSQNLINISSNSFLEEIHFNKILRQYTLTWQNQKPWCIASTTQSIINNSVPMSGHAHPIISFETVARSIGADPGPLRDMQVVADYINSFFIAASDGSHLVYHVTNIPNGFGQGQEDMEYIQHRIIASISINAPVILNISGRNPSDGSIQPSGTGHSILVVGVTTHGELNPSETIYWYYDPQDQNSASNLHWFTGNDLQTIFHDYNSSSEPMLGSIIAPQMSAVEDSSHNLNITIPSQEINQNDYSSQLDIDLNMTELAGFTSLNELQEFANLELPEFSNNWYEWGLKHLSRSDDHWNIKNWLIGTSSENLEYSLGNWEGFFNYAYMYWYSWFTISNGNNALNVILHYKEIYKNAVLTVVPIKISMTTGTKIRFNK